MTSNDEQLERRIRRAVMRQCHPSRVGFVLSGEWVNELMLKILDELNRERDEREGEEATMDVIETRMLDITGPNVIEFEVRNDGKTIWVHVDGITLLRAYNVVEVVVNDHRDEHGDDKPVNCGQPWVAEIELCPRCGLDATAHVDLKHTAGPRHPHPTDASLATQRAENPPPRTGGDYTTD